MAFNIRLTFLGTSSAQPSLTRNHSSLAVQIDGALWLFDCGEATQIQLQRAESCRISRVQRIFVTHLHGDHIFGIVGLMCTLANSINKPDFCLQLYGPSGLRKFVRNSLKYSFSRLTYKYSVNELIFDETERDLDCDYHLDEVPGEDITPDSNHIWNVLQSDNITVTSTFIQHRVPCLGYVLQEDETPGRLMIEKIQPILKQHEKEFGERGVRNPMALLASFKTGEPISLPNGTILRPEFFLEPPRPTRKIVVLGDTCDPSNISKLASNADVLVHEATNAFLTQDAQSTTSEAVRELCISHGHSTPEMAGEFARLTNSRLLILNHFSSRYRGDDSPESRAVMEEIRQLAVNKFGCDQVLTAYDLLTVDVRRQEPLA